MRYPRHSAKLKESRQTLSGDDFRQRRKVLKLTQTEVAERVGCHPAYITQIEAGTKYPATETLGKLYLALEMEPPTRTCKCGVEIAIHEMKCWACWSEETAAAWRKKRL